MTDLKMKSYRRPPITEAVIEFRMAKEITRDQEKKIVQRLQKDFPHSQETDEYAIVFNPKKHASSGMAPVDKRHKAVRLTSDDQTDIAIVTLNGVTSARLAPYLGWEAFIEQAQKVWSAWQKVVNSNLIQRIGVRFINRIDIPFTSDNKFELNDYLNFYPETPSLSTEPMKNFFIQVSTTTDNPYWETQITSTRANPQPIPKHASLLLDIDIFRVAEISSKEPDLWEIVGEARDIKNNLFQRCITKKSEELFE